MRRWRRPVHHKLDHIIHLIHELGDTLMTSQEQIDADVTALTAAEGRIAAGVQALRDEIANLQGQGVDTTALDAIAAKFTADADADSAPTAT